MAKVHRVIGTTGDDVLYGRNAPDYISGKGGDDTIRVTTGDRAFGGAGDDTFNIRNITGNGTRIEGGIGEDVARFNGNMSDFSVSYRANGTVVVFDADGDKVKLRNVETLEFKDGVWKSEAHDQNLSDAATDDDGTLLNNGVPGEHFNLSTANAFGITTGLVAHKYGDVYEDGYVAGNVYVVDGGVSSIRSDRADWSFGMSVENNGDFSLGDAETKGDFDVGIWFDINPGKGDDFVFLANLEEIPDSATSNPDVFQNSWNINFDFIKSLLPAEFTDDFEGPAEFGIELRLTEVATGRVSDVNHIDVLVL